MRRSFVAIAFISSVVYGALSPGDADAQQDPAPAQSRRVKGHVFLVPTLQDSAFVTTHVGIREGFALFEVPDLPVGRFGTRDITLSGIQQSLDLGLRLTDWLGLFGFGKALLITGTDQTSLVVDGASVDFVGQAGAIVRLLANETTGTQVSLRARASRRHGQEVTVHPLVLALIETVPLTIADVSDGVLGRLILVPTSETSVGGGAHAAQYINRYLSAQASVSMERGWITREPFRTDLARRASDDADVLTVQLAAALALDFSSLFAPVSLLGEYMYRLGERTHDRRPDVDLGASTLGLGVYYVGRPNLQLGVGGVVTLSAEPRPGVGAEGESDFSGDPTLTYVDLILRYIW
jgi:hypothetical protein